MSIEQTEHLVKMANQIALNMGEHRDLEEAVQRTREHLEKFWTPDMRRKLSAYAAGGGTGLAPAVSLLLRDDLLKDRN